MSKKGFSFIELIIVVSILLLLAVIGVTVSSTYKENTENTKISADISTLKNSLSQFYEETKTLPLPGGNTSYYDTESNYIHDEVGAFGVHGFITEKTLPKNYINYLPIDPRTQQYYGYGKTITHTAFEVAGVLKNNLDYSSLVQGNYDGEGGPLNLIREYNGPDFVFNESSENFPYNPEEKVVTGKITSFNGNVTINDTVGVREEILAFTLKEGDVIKVPQNGYASIYFTDGSHSVLGSTSSASELKIAKMTFSDETNLFTKIQLALSIGSLWTQAARLSDSSEFEVYTTDTTAAVRGTIFSLSKDPGTTNVTVENGKIKIAKLNNITSFGRLIDTISQESEIEETPIVAAGDTVQEEEEGKLMSFIDATTGSKGLNISTSNTPPISSIRQILTKKDVSNNVKIKLLTIDGTSPTARKLEFYLPNRILGVERIVIKKDNGEILEAQIPTGKLIGNTLTIDGSYVFNPLGSPLDLASGIRLFNLDKMKLKMCLGSKCTRYIDILFPPIGQKITNIDSLDANEANLSACKFSFVDPKTKNCIPNRLADTPEPYELVGFADYRQYENTGAIVTKDGMIEAGNFDSNTIELDKSNGQVQGIKLKTGKLNYNFSKLNLGDNYIIEMRLNGRALNEIKNQAGGYNYVFKSSTYFKISWYGNSLKMLASSLTPPEGILFTKTDLFEDDKWYLLEFKFNNTSPVGGIYSTKYNATIIGETPASIINLRPVTSATGSSVLGNLDQVFLGSGGTSNFWKGTIQGLRFYKKVVPPKEGTDKSYIQRVGLVTPTIANPNCTATPSNVPIPGSASISCSIAGTIGYSSLNYTWTKTTGTGTLGAPTTGSVTNFALPITANVSNINATGINTFKFEVSDTNGNKKSALATITSSTNNPPSFTMAPNQTFDTTVKTSTIVAISGLSDPDLDTPTLLWSQVSGPSGITIMSPNSASTEIKNFSHGDYVFRFKADDGKGGVTTKNMNITVTTLVSGNNCESCPGGLFTESNDWEGANCWARQNTGFPLYNTPKEWKCTNVTTGDICGFEGIYSYSCERRPHSWSGLLR